MYGLQERYQEQQRDCRKSHLKQQQQQQEEELCSSNSSLHKNKLTSSIALVHSINAHNTNIDSSSNSDNNNRNVANNTFTFQCPVEHINELNTVKATFNITHHYFDGWIYLFLSNKKYDTTETIAKLHRRAEMERNVFRHYVITPSLRSSMRAGIVQYVGDDKAGRPVLYFNTCRDHPTSSQRAERQANLDMFLSWAVRLQRTNPECGVTWLINQHHASLLRNTDLVFQKDMALRTSKFYPGTVARMYLCNMNSALTFVMKPLLRQLPKVISETIFFFSHNDIKSGKLLEVIDASVLPVAMGGANDCDHQSNYDWFAEQVESYFNRCVTALNHNTSIKEMEMMEEYNVDREGRPITLPEERRLQTQVEEEEKEEEEEEEDEEEEELLLEERSQESNKHISDNNIHKDNVVVCNEMNNESKTNKIRDAPMQVKSREMSTTELSHNKSETVANVITSSQELQINKWEEEVEIEQKQQKLNEKELLFSESLSHINTTISAITTKVNAVDHQVKTNDNTESNITNDSKLLSSNEIYSSTTNNNKIAKREELLEEEEEEELYSDSDGSNMKTPIEAFSSSDSDEEREQQEEGKTMTETNNKHDLLVSKIENHNNVHDLYNEIITHTKSNDNNNNNNSDNTNNFNNTNNFTSGNTHVPESKTQSSSSSIRNKSNSHIDHHHLRISSPLEQTPLSIAFDEDQVIITSNRYKSEIRWNDRHNADELPLDIDAISNTNNKETTNSNKSQHQANAQVIRQYSSLHDSFASGFIATPISDLISFRVEEHKCRSLTSNVNNSNNNNNNNITTVTKSLETELVSSNEVKEGDTPKADKERSNGNNSIVEVEQKQVDRYECVDANMEEEKEQEQSKYYSSSSSLTTIRGSVKKEAVEFTNRDDESVNNINNNNNMKKKKTVEQKSILLRCTTSTEYREFVSNYITYKVAEMAKYIKGCKDEQITLLKERWNQFVNVCYQVEEPVERLLHALERQRTNKRVCANIDSINNNDNNNWYEQQTSSSSTSENKEQEKITESVLEMIRVHVPDITRLIQNLLLLSVPSSCVLYVLPDGSVSTSSSVPEEKTITTTAADQYCEEHHNNISNSNNKNLSHCGTLQEQNEQSQELQTAKLELEQLEERKECTRDNDTFASLLEPLYIDCTSADNLLLSLQASTVVFVEQCEQMITLHKTHERILRRTLLAWSHKMSHEEFVTKLEWRATQLWHELTPWFTQYIECKVGIAIASFLAHYGLLVSNGKIDSTAEWYKTLFTSLVHFRELHRQSWLFHLFPPLSYNNNENNNKKSSITITSTNIDSKINQNDTNNPNVSYTTELEILPKQPHETEKHEELTEQELLLEKELQGKEQEQLECKTHLCYSAAPPSVMELLIKSHLPQTTQGLVTLIAMIKTSLEATLEQLKNITSLAAQAQIDEVASRTCSIVAADVGVSHSTNNYNNNSFAISTQMSQINSNNSSNNNNNNTRMADMPQVLYTNHSIIDRYLENTHARISIPFESQSMGLSPTEMIISEQIKACAFLTAAETLLKEFLLAIASLYIFCTLTTQLRKEESSSSLLTLSLLVKIEEKEKEEEEELQEKVKEQTKSKEKQMEYKSNLLQSTYCGRGVKKLSVCSDTDKNTSVVELTAEQKHEVCNNDEHSKATQYEQKEELLVTSNSNSNNNNNNNNCSTVTQLNSNNCNVSQENNVNNTIITRRQHSESNEVEEGISNFHDDTNNSACASTSTNIILSSKSNNNSKSINCSKNASLRKLLYEELSLVRRALVEERRQRRICTAFAMVAYHIQCSGTIYGYGGTEDNDSYTRTLCLCDNESKLSKSNWLRDYREEEESSQREQVISHNDDNNNNGVNRKKIYRKKEEEKKKSKNNSKMKKTEETEVHFKNWHNCKNTNNNSTNDNHNAYHKSNVNVNVNRLTESKKETLRKHDQIKQEANNSSVKSNIDTHTINNNNNNDDDNNNCKEWPSYGFGLAIQLMEMIAYLTEYAETRQLLQQEQEQQQEEQYQEERKRNTSVSTAERRYKEYEEEEQQWEEEEEREELLSSISSVESPHLTNDMYNNNNNKTTRKKNINSCCPIDSKEMRNTRNQLMCDVAMLIDVACQANEYALPVAEVKRQYIFVTFAN